MRGFRPLMRELRIFYLRWALREIDPMHADTPEIVLELRQLLNERAANAPSPLQVLWRWL